MKRAVSFLTSVFLLLLILQTSCKRDSEVFVPDVSQIEIDWNWQRLDREIFALDTTALDAGLNQLEKKYPLFLPFYDGNLLEIGPPGIEKETWGRLKFYASNVDTRALYDSCLVAFPTMNAEEAQLKRAFQLYKYYFPNSNNKTPSLVIHTSAFGPMAFTLGEDLLGINLEMFLGKDFSLYPTAGFPDYLTYSFQKECLAPMAMLSWLRNKYPAPNATRFLDQMIHRGKIYYLLDRLLPNTEDQFKIAYPKEKLDWCFEDEAQIWAFFIEQKMLYETKTNKYINYLTEGPTSAGMPFESPGNIGTWVGWQIVRKFMQRNPETTHPELMKITDGQKILAKSKYKPSK